MYFSSFCFYLSPCIINSCLLALPFYIDREKEEDNAKKNSFDM